MMCAQIQPDLPAFVLGGLEPEEAAEVERSPDFLSRLQKRASGAEKVNSRARGGAPTRRATQLPQSRDPFSGARGGGAILYPTRRSGRIRSLCSSDRDLPCSSSLQPLQGSPHPLPQRSSRSCGCHCRPRESSLASCEKNLRWRLSS